MDFKKPEYFKNLISVLIKEKLENKIRPLCHSPPSFMINRKGYVSVKFMKHAILSLIRMIEFDNREEVKYVCNGNKVFTDELAFWQKLLILATLGIAACCICKPVGERRITKASLPNFPKPSFRFFLDYERIIVELVKGLPKLLYREDHDWQFPCETAFGFILETKGHFNLWEIRSKTELMGDDELIETEPVSLKLSVRSSLAEEGHPIFDEYKEKNLDPPDYEGPSKPSAPPKDEIET
jgi:hypothetical protein